MIYKEKTNYCHPKFEFPLDWHITHAPKHWSTEQTLLQDIEEIIIPYVEAQRADLEANKRASVIIDNFKGQIL